MASNWAISAKNCSWICDNGYHTLPNGKDLNITLSNKDLSLRSGTVFIGGDSLSLEIHIYEKKKDKLEENKEKSFGKVIFRNITANTEKIEVDLEGCDWKSFHCGFFMQENGSEMSLIYEEILQ